MEKEINLIEHLQLGEKILCHECGKGFYITNAKDTRISHEFFCENCNSVVRVTPNIIVT